MQNPMPSIIRSLKAMEQCLMRGQEFCAERNINESVLLDARLFPDMFDLKRNVQAACDISRLMASRLSQAEPVAHEDTETTFAELYARIEKTIAYLNAIPDSAYEGAEDRDIVMKFGPEEVTFTAQSFISSFATPNIYFHITTAYNIMRTNGVGLGKRLYLGGS